jgi:hypothetical protein
MFSSPAIANKTMQSTIINCLIRINHLQLVSHSIVQFGQLNRGDKQTEAVMHSSKPSQWTGHSPRWDYPAILVGRHRCSHSLEYSDLLNRKHTLISLVEFLSETSTQIYSIKTLATSSRKNIVQVYDK